ncbi:CRISPR-associated helicase Cas3' [Aerococcus urinae]|uniref:CRISPR-associated helicase Cas3' n=1 Tax=Aerococcus urinae TaxID=1376 RepID=UPI00227CAE5D|nr:CRISPR-associated helicase Cas3' [Aerococcus urinae]MCY3031855.1 CRISPR-associated helicase Cas3' [Aerococcus urinae]
MISALWGKKSEKIGQFYWLPLIQHLKDTYGVAGALWEHWMSPGQKEFIQMASHTNSDGAKKLYQYLAAIHDGGKASPAFQAMPNFSHHSEDLEKLLLEKLERAGFIGISKVQLSDRQKSHHSLAGQALLIDDQINKDIASIVGAHHGKPVDSNRDYKYQLKSYGNNYFQSDNPDAPIYQTWQRAQKNIFNWALNLSGYTQVDELPEISQAGQVLLAGALIMADWIASNEHYFPLIPIDHDSVSDFSQSRLEKGFTQWKKTDLWQPHGATDIDQFYEDRFKFSPRDMQQVFSETIEASDQPGIFILEAPMGLGKTEAALAGAEQLAFKTGRSGVYFGLPTQATSNGIFPRIKDWLERVEELNGDKASLRLAHGKAALNDDFAKLAHQVDPDGGEESTIITNEWFAGRKTTALDDFVVGTVDQFLLLALKQKHLMLRHLGFSKKVVIIDEVHSYDAYMSTYLYRALEWMGAYQVPVIILSATLPADKRLEMIQSYLKGRKKQVKRIDTPDQFNTTAYPLITYTDGDTVHQETHFDDKDIKYQTVKVHKLPVMEQMDILIELVEDLLQSGGVIGIIVNTVKRAQVIAKALSKQIGEDFVELLHSNFIATERAAKENHLLQQIGKDKKRPERKVIIGTQVIEQSLDIDFDVLISDLAPMDLLIQRVGRMHRHEINRPSKHHEPVLYVLGISESLEFEKGSESVYGGYLLARTQYFLPDILNIPNDISSLVQAVYSDKTMDLNHDIQAKYEEMVLKYESYLKSKKAKAKGYLLASPDHSGKKTLVGWLKSPSTEESEERAYAQVRDSQETIEVIALKKIGSGYGTFAEEVDLSERIDDPNVAKEIAKETLRLPYQLSYLYNDIIDKNINFLERYNLKYLSEWQEQSWLKGSLGIIFDENHEFVINDYKLMYDQKYGLICERM